MSDLVWKDIPSQWPMDGYNDIEAVTDIGTYTISGDQPAAGGRSYLWLAGNESDEHDRDFPGRYEARKAAQDDYDSRILSNRGTQAGE